jgi:hypothetical protein
MFKLLSPAFGGALALAAAVSFAPSANAVTYSFSGQSAGGATVNAKADVTLGAGTVTIILTDLLQNPTSAGQLVSGFQFDATGVTGSGALATLNSGLVTTIASDGTGNYSAGVADSLTRWTASHTNSTVKLTTLSGGNPNRLIIGPDSSGNLDPSLGGKYSNANASIRGNGNPNSGDNPSILGSATFVLSIAGITTDSLLSNIRILFGTGTDYASVCTTDCPQNAPPPPPAVPVPGAAWLMGSVVGLGLGAAQLRRRRRVKQPN